MFMHIFFLQEWQRMVFCLHDSSVSVVMYEKQDLTLEKQECLQHVGQII